MKIRIASVTLALALAFSVVSMACAADAAGPEDLTDPVELLQEEQAEQDEEQAALFYLDGEPLYGVVCQSINGTYYVTLASMMALIDPNAVVEETAGKATLTAEAVVVSDQSAPWQEPEAPEGEASGDAGQSPQDGEAVQPPQDGEAGTPEDETGAQSPADETGTQTPADETDAQTPADETDAQAPADETGGQAPAGETDGQAPVDETTAQPPEAEDAFRPLAVGEAVAEVLDTLTLTAVAGEEYLVANDRYLYAEDGIITLDGSVAVPLRLLAEALKLSVWFDQTSKSVYLTSSSEVGYLEDGESYYDSEAVYWLSRIIYCESGNQVLEGQIAVGNVVLNRVSDPKFPNSIYAVIFQKNQFGPASSGSINRDPNESSVIAAKLALDGAVVLDGVLFFNRAGQVCYASRNRTYVATIGNHAFYA